MTCNIFMLFQSSQTTSVSSSLSCCHGLTSSVLAVADQLSFSGHLVLQMNSSRSNEPLQGPSCYLSFTAPLQSVNIHLDGHIIIGTLMFVLLPRGGVGGIY